MILIINNHDYNASKIANIIKKLGMNCTIKDSNSLIKNYEKSNIKGVILTGGPLMLDKHLSLSSIHADLASIFDFDVPIIGICLGHEIIAEVMGSVVERLKIPSKSNKQTLKILKKEYLFEGFPSEINVFESHSLFIKDLPKLFEITATSDKDRIESIRHKTKPIFGVQFHPEESDMGEKLFSNFIKICKEYNKKY